MNKDELLKSLSDEDLVKVTTVLEMMENVEKDIDELRNLYLQQNGLPIPDYLRIMYFSEFQELLSSKLDEVVPNEIIEEIFRKEVTQH